MKQLVLGMMIAGAPMAALAQDQAAQLSVTYAAAGSYDDTVFALENAIINRGLKVDHVSHVGDMLARTGADLGMATRVFDQAQVQMFCSAVLSRKVMQIDPLNIVHCPYRIFVYAADGAVTVGHARLPDGPMQEVEALLSDIAQEAADGF